MPHLRTVLAGGIILFVLIGGFMLFVPRANESEEEPAISQHQEPPTVSLANTYAEGTRTLSGTLMVPTACSTLDASASLEGNAVALSLSVPDISGVCLEIPEERSFSVSLEAPEDASIAVFVNGEAVEVLEQP